MLTARVSDSMFYPLTLCALQIAFMIMTLQSTTLKIDPNSVVLVHSVLTVSCGNITFWHLKEQGQLLQTDRASAFMVDRVKIFLTSLQNFPTT